jgi:hypothetical protein
MKNNINKQIANIENLEKPLIKVEKIAEQAKLFRKNTVKQRKKTETCCVRNKVFLLILFGIFAVLSILYFYHYP